MKQCDIHAIAKELNSRSSDFAIGKLQEIRKSLKGLSKRSGKHIFSNQTIHDEWSFHHGGRSEIQFNIGKDGSGGTKLRHGIAFSFETSRSFPSIDPLKPKVRLFNDYMKLNAEDFSGMRMWHFRDNVRSDDYMPSPIPDERVRTGVFVFLGRLNSIDDVDYDEILKDFDKLLPLYRYVESDGASQPTLEPHNPAFSFESGCTIKPDKTTAKITRGTIDIELRHNVMQELLCKQLASKYGADNVRAELPSGVGTRIDVCVRDSDSFWFYEIKTARSPRACIREAIGQLLEYSFWPNSQEANKLIIVGESPLDTDGKVYLDRLNEDFSLPIEYEHLEMDSLA